jgi:23S rRNA (uracil-5-)-methyltransferase RumA
LYDTVVDVLCGEKDDVLLDLYCGTGTIGIMLARYVQEVIGVEQVSSAIENAEVNRKKNGIDNIRFAVGSVEKWIKHGDKPAFNALVVDPPRGGLSNKVVDFIAANSPKKLVYVSCNPSTLARDLTDIIAKGNYTIEAIIPVDMFPHTFHVETVVSLRK